MTTKDITIDIKQGVEASPVAKCVQVASQFESKIYVEYKEHYGNDGFRTCAGTDSKGFCRWCR